MVTNKEDSALGSAICLPSKENVWDSCIIDLELMDLWQACHKEDCSQRYTNHSLSHFNAWARLARFHAIKPQWLPAICSIAIQYSLTISQ